MLLVAALAGGACADGRAEPLGVLGAEVFDVELPDPSLWPARSPIVPLTPLSDPNARRDGGTLLLARWSGYKIALIADADARALRIIDADRHDETNHVPLGGEPSQLAIGGDGRIWIALRDKNEIVAVEMTPEGTLQLGRRAATDAEPVALAVSADGMQLFVASGWGHTFSGYTIPSAERRFSIALDREPRGIAIPGDGTTAYIAHAVGSVISKVPLPASDAVLAPEAWPAHETIALAGMDFNTGFGPMMPTPPDIPTLRSDVDFIGDLGLKGDHMGRRVRRHSSARDARVDVSSSDVDRRAAQGFAVASLDGDVFVPQVLVHRGDATTGGYGTSESFEAHQPVVMQIRDGVTSIRELGRVFEASGSRQGSLQHARHDDCRLPRAAAVDPIDKTVLIACLGTNEVRAYGAEPERLATSIRGRWKLPSGPMGIAVDAPARHALVWSQFDAAISTIPLPDPEAAERNLVRFHSASTDRPLRSTVLRLMAPRDKPWMSKAAYNGRKIFHGAGDRRIAFDGRACASCHPDGRDDGLTWPTPHGPRQTPMLAGRLDAATAPYGWQGESDTIAIHLKDTFQRLSGQGLEGEDLDALMAYLDEMSVPATPATMSDVVSKGKELFHAETVGCATCHTQSGEGSDGARHNVGSGPLLETPSLRFVAGTAPYFHDGRYETLSDMLRATKGTMGWGGELSGDDLAAIEAYLMTL